MLLALKDDKLIEAIPRNYGAVCPGCLKEVIPVCGPIYIHHWRHINGNCIYHTEPETEWHRQWKKTALNLEMNIEVPFHFNGIYKRADIYDPKTNTVIELQHSPMSEDKILERTIFYINNGINIRWIFDYTRRFHITDLPNLPIYTKDIYIRKYCLYEHRIDYYYDLCDEDRDHILLYKKFGIGEDIIYSFNNFKFNDNHLIEYLKHKYYSIEEERKDRQRKWEEWERKRQQKRKKRNLIYGRQNIQTKINEQLAEIRTKRNSIYGGTYKIICGACGNSTMIKIKDITDINQYLNKRHICGGELRIESQV